MTKMCIVVLDGVVADATARFAKAEEAKQASTLDYKQTTDLYWRTVFTPDLVQLDTLIEGAQEALERLMAEGYLLIYLTSRPEAMRVATLTWLMDHDILHYGPSGAIQDIELVMKPPAFQYTKTVVWKAGMIQHLAAFYQAEEVIFIDDEHANWEELWKYDPAIRCYASLAEAVAGPEAAATEGEEYP